MYSGHMTTTPATTSGYTRKGLNTRIAEELDRAVAPNFRWHTETADDGRLVYVIDIDGLVNGPMHLSPGGCAEWLGLEF